MNLRRPATGAGPRPRTASSQRTGEPPPRRETRAPRPRLAARRARSDGTGPPPRLAGELPLRDVVAHELPQLEHVIHADRRRDETPARLEHPVQLGQRPLEVGHVVQHRVGHGAVELTLLEGKRLNVREPRVQPARRRDLDHPRREVGRNHLGRGLTSHPLGELTHPAADLEHAVWMRLDDSREGGVEAVGPLAVPRLRLTARLQPSLGLVLPPHELGVVQPHGSTIGWPGSDRPGDFPPSHTLTVAPTSANSPSWIWPAALRPWT